MLIKRIPLKFVKKISKKRVFTIIIIVKAFWKIFNGKKILFLINENFKYVKLVIKLIFKELFYFGRFFSKKELTYIILLKLKYDVIFKFINNFSVFGFFKYKTFIKYIFFKKSTLKIIRIKIYKILYKSLRYAGFISVKIIFN